MRKVLGVTYNCNNNKEREVVLKCLNVVYAKSELINIPQHKVVDHLIEGTTAITFGKTAANIVSSHLENIKGVSLYKLPKPEQLLDRPCNQEEREETYKILLEIKDLLDRQTDITENLQVTIEDLPKWRSEQVLLLMKRMEEEDKSTVATISLNGKILEISKELNKNSNADIHLTISELYSLKCIMEIFQVSEVKLERKEEQLNEPTN